MDAADPPPGHGRIATCSQIFAIDQRPEFDSRPGQSRRSSMFCRDNALAIRLRQRHLMSGAA